MASLMKIKATGIKIMIAFLPLLFSCRTKERQFVVSGDKCFMVSNADSLHIGSVYLDEGLFREYDSLIFPDENADIMLNPVIEKSLDKIVGIYINSRIFDCFQLTNGVINKMSNAFDVYLIYSEITRYNFQFGRAVGYRVSHYTGNFYQELSSSENLPYFVYNIVKQDDNSFKLTFVDKSNYMANHNQSEDLRFIAYPRIQIENPNSTLVNIFGSSHYFKLSDKIIEETDISLKGYMLPQDYTEEFITEVITKLINLKYNINIKKSDINNII